MPFEKAKAELKKLKGIGDYSSEVILPHGEAFPIDIWSAQIFHKLFFPKRQVPPKQEAIRIVRKQAAERWGRWRRLAFVYILNDLVNFSKIFKIKL
jgi:3-methyladenine DNA glycosylase/8-oxoguanine DNA glycosylase